MTLPFDPDHHPATIGSPSYRPDLYASMFRLDSDDPHRGTAIVGGIWRAPQYALSYLLGARLILEQAMSLGHMEEVALPVAFLQRHCLELGLKNLVDLARSVHADAQRLHALQAGIGASPPLIEPEASWGHALPKLVIEAREALGAIAYDLPNELATLADDLDAAEDGHPDRFRYERVGNPRISSPSLSASIELPLLARQERLEAVFDRHLVYRPDALDRLPDGVNLWEALQIESEALFQALLRFGVGP